MKQGRKESQLQRCGVVELGAASVPDPVGLPMMCLGTVSLGEEREMHLYTVLYPRGQRVAPQGINGLFNSQFAPAQMPHGFPHVTRRTRTGHGDPSLGALGLHLLVRAYAELVPAVGVAKISR